MRKMTVRMMILSLLIAATVPVLIAGTSALEKVYIEIKDKVEYGKKGEAFFAKNKSSETIVVTIKETNSGYSNEYEVTLSPRGKKYLGWKRTALIYPKWQILDAQYQDD
jgi:hypothetical protein